MCNDGRGNYQSKTLREAAILTGSYVVASNDEFTPADVMSANQIILFVDFTKGSLTTAEVKIEYSNDGTTWFQESFGSVSSGTNTISLGENALGATGKYTIISDIAGKYVRVSAKGTGTATGSSMTIEAALKTT